MKTCTIINIDRCSLNDGPGIRTVIFFKGCNLRCAWCHNPETYTFGVQEYQENNQVKFFGYNTTTSNIKKEIAKDILYYQKSKGGVTFSGGEALLQVEPLKDILIYCKEKEIHVCVETCGQVPLTTIKTVLPYVDCWLFDYKLSTKEDYIKYTKTDPTSIYDNLEYLIKCEQEIILRCPLIPTINDNDFHFENIVKISKCVSSVEILPYHNLGKAKAEKLNIQNYFVKENATEEMKQHWKSKLEMFGCKNFKIK